MRQVDLIVSQHESFVSWARRRGLADESTPHMRTVTAEDLRGKSVLTTAMPLHLAAAAERVHEVTLELSPEMRGTVLTVDQLDETYRRVSQYSVRRVTVEMGIRMYPNAFLSQAGIELIATRHQAFVDLLHGWGVSNDVPVIPHAQLDDVRGRVVAGILPLWLAAETSKLVTVDLNVPESLRGQELTVPQMLGCCTGVTAYFVARRDALQEVGA